MKRNLFFILVAILISLSLSQGSFAAGFENPYKIQVRRLSWFKPEYLTITYAGTFNILEKYGYYSFDPSTGKKGTNNFTHPKDKTIANLSLFNHLTHNKYKDLCWEPIENLFGCLTTNPQISTYPAIYSIVLKVDSIDAKDWDESMFYKTVRDGKRHEIELLSFSSRGLTTPSLTSTTQSPAPSCWGKESAFMPGATPAGMDRPTTRSTPPGLRK